MINKLKRVVNERVWNRMSVQERIIYLKHFKGVRIK